MATTKTRPATKTKPKKTAGKQATPKKKSPQQTSFVRKTPVQSTQSVSQPYTNNILLLSVAFTALCVVFLLLAIYNYR
jgi:hypothetical protein